MEQQNYLSEKIGLWKHLDDHLNKVESSLTNVNVIGALLVAILSLVDKTDFNMFLIIPLIITFILFYITYQQRVVEILRGHIIYLEEKIENEIQENSFSWSKISVMTHYNKSFNAQKLSGSLFTIVMGVGTVYSFVKMFTIYEKNILFVAAYLVVFIFFNIAFAIDIFNNPKIHKAVIVTLNNSCISPRT